MMPKVECQHHPFSHCPCPEVPSAMCSSALPEQAVDVGLLKLHLHLLQGLVRTRASRVRQGVRRNGRVRGCRISAVIQTHWYSHMVVSGDVVCETTRLV